MAVRYFAYGSNMCLEQMGERCPGADLVCVASLTHYRFRINRRGVATVVPEPGAMVYGVVWDLHLSHVETLDRYEGIQAGTYTKEYFGLGINPPNAATIQPMDDDKSETENCLVYLASDSSIGSPRKGYLERIVGAVQIHNLSQGYMKEITKWATDFDG